MINLNRLEREHFRAIEAKEELDRRAAIRNRSVYEAVAQGVSAVEIAKKLNIGRARVYQMIQAHQKTTTQKEKES